MPGPKTTLDFVTVKTTLPSIPYPPVESRAPIRTERLLLRPYRESDAEELYNVLRSRPEVMIFTARGKVDENIEVTRSNIQKRLPPYDESNYDWIICLAETGELVGIGGSHLRVGEMGWPALGYMFRKDAWGKGYGTEFVRAFLDAWWKLPRAELELKVDADTVDGGQDGDVKVERIIGVTVDDNKASQNVMGKCGMKHVKIWRTEDSHEEGGLVDLYAFAGMRPDPAAI